MLLRQPTPDLKIVATVLGRSFPSPMNPPLRRRAVALDGLRGYVYSGAPQHLLERAAHWLSDEPIEADEVLRPGRVFRSGEFVVKRFPVGRGLRDRLRPAAALRAAEQHFEILPLRSPRPWLALQETLGRNSSRSLLVNEFIDGPCLYECLESNPRARAAFPEFLADMHRRRVLHDDFQLSNCRWVKDEWALIDLIGLRHGLRSLMVGPAIRRHWIAILFWLELHPAGRELFEEWSRILPWPGNRERLWRSAVIGAKTKLRGLVDRTGSGPSGLRYSAKAVARGGSLEDASTGDS